MSVQETAGCRGSRRQDAGQTAPAGPGEALIALTLPGTPASVCVARWVLGGVAAGSPRLDDLKIILSELATNAIKHTPSGRDDGTLTITVTRGPGRVRIEVEDQGAGQPGSAACADPCGDAPADIPPGDPLAEYGRGIALVGALADATGHARVAAGGHRCWAEVTW
jgi:serine/threonine-protein kinase RsbW